MARNTTKWIVGAVILVVIVIGAVLIFTPKETGAIKIGFIGPLTGEAAIYGIEDRNAMMLAVNKINEGGGINGRQIQVIEEDGKCTGKDATNAAQKLINVDGVKVILGGSCSGETLAIAPIAEASKVLVFSSLSTSPDITRAGDFIFRNAPSDLDNGKATANLAFRNGLRKVAIISENTDYAQGFKRVFKDRFEEIGGEIVADEVYDPDATDFRTIITKVMSSDPDGILIDPQGKAGGLVAKQLKDQGYSGPLYGNVVFAGSELLGTYRDILEGLYFSDAAGLDISNDKAASFVSNYERTYGKKPAFDYYAGARYDSVYIIAGAIEKVGYDAEKIKDYLYGLNYNGVLGNYHFDVNGDVVGIKFEDKQIKNGKVETII